MRPEQLHDVIGELPEELLTPVEALRKKKQIHWARWASLAAACLLILAAKKYLRRKEHPAALALCRKLQKYLAVPVTNKQIRAFQVLAGGNAAEAKAFLEAGGAAGMSTFMAYDILSAAAQAGSDQPLSMLKSYYGGMLDRGATTFWEDFDLDWLEGSSRIDEMPAAGEKDLHGDYGKFCYLGFRHSFCHGWAAGVLAFIVEHICGLQITDGGKKITVTPHMSGLTDLDAQFPTEKGWVQIHIHGNDAQIVIPE